MTAKPTVAIIYGFAEGPATSRKLRKQLAEKGFRVIRDAAKADITIIHSGGIYKIPANNQNKLQVIVAPTLSWDGKSPLKYGLQKVGADLRDALAQKKKVNWLLRSGLNFAYVAAKPVTAAKMWRASKRLGPVLPGSNTQRIVICYKNDPWSGNTGPDHLTQHPAAAFVSHRALHDDIWTNPQEYITVIQYLYES